MVEVNTTTPQPDPLVRVRDVFGNRNSGPHPRFRDVLPEGYNRFALTRAILQGILSHDRSRRVRCRAQRVGQSWAVRPSWVSAFFADLSNEQHSVPVADGLADADAEAILAADNI